MLLDTCAAIWSASGDPTLGRAARTAIAAAARADRLSISAITAWEIGTLARKGRLTLAISPRAFIDRLFGQPGVKEEVVDREIAALASMLTDDFHGDPADRIIVATSIVRGLRLVTRDDRILAYAKHTRALPTLRC